jgi:prolyl 4-hydroxylase
MKVTSLTLPGRQPGDKYCVWVENVFSEEDCKEIIASSEDGNQFQAASMIPDLEGGQMKNPNRNNDRVSTFNQRLTQKLYDRIESLLPDHWEFENEHWLKQGCNTRMSILRYLPGQHYSPHVDVEYVTEDGLSRSFVTAQLYLNEGFEGGATQFIQEVGYRSIGEREVLDVVPKTGAVLLFEHELLHTGQRLVSGCKYTIRTDIMYAKQ